MNRKVIQIASALLITALMSTTANAVEVSYNGWADEYIRFCNQKRIISGDENGDLMPGEKLTREQMVKMVLTAFDIDISQSEKATYEDILEDRWSYPYISKYAEYDIKKDANFMPEEYVKREEFLAMAVKISGFGDGGVENASKFNLKFSDDQDISEEYYDLIVSGYEKNFITGDDGKINPKSYLNRAEACSLLYKLINAIEYERLKELYSSKDETDEQVPEVKEDEDVTEEIIPTTITPLVAQSEVTLEQAKQWAKNRGAHQRFIDVADLYWKYEELTGLRADILYAQAAKETNFGKYTGKVQPEQNNWAGIKKYGATGDEPEDHEDFETVEDGVRGHFNHMSAYVGLEPVGEPHARYKSVKSLAWAGMVETVEQLSGKWCPAADYGISIVNNFLEPMKNTVIR